MLGWMGGDLLGMGESQEVITSLGLGVPQRPEAAGICRMFQHCFSGAEKRALASGGKTSGC